jgi:hypothetical protein
MAEAVGGRRALTRPEDETAARERRSEEVPS